MATHSSILAGECLGQRSLVGYSPQSLKELDTTELLSLFYGTPSWGQRIVSELKLPTLVSKEASLHLLRG